MSLLLKNFENIFEKRKQEADEFYNAIIPTQCNDDQKNIQRQRICRPSLE